MRVAPSLHPSQGMRRKDCAGRVEPGLCSLFQLQQPWLLLCLHGVRRWLLSMCSKLRERRNGSMPPFLPPSCQQRKQKCLLSLSHTGFAGLSLSLLCLSSGPLLLPDVDGFSHHFYFLTVWSGWGFTSTSAPWLAWDLCFLYVGSSDFED